MRNRERKNRIPGWIRRAMPLAVALCLLSAAGGEAPGIIRMLPLGERTEEPAAEGNGPEAASAAAENPAGAIGSDGILRMLPLDGGTGTPSGDAPGDGTAFAGVPDAAETRETGTAELTEMSGQILAGVPDTAETGEAGRTADAKGLWIYGPEKMRAGTKKYYKPRFSGEKPKRYRATWRLDCGPDVAQVFRNGQVWVRPKAPSGTVLTLTCHIRGRDASGQPWEAETDLRIEVR